jgi:hypothetical protein
MRATTREPYRVYTQDEFFAEDGLFAAGESGVDDERGPHAGKSRRSTGGRRAYGARRAAGVAMLIGAAAAVVVVLAIDAFPHAGGSRRRGALMRVAREVTRGPSADARSLGRPRLPRALARQSRRDGRLAHLRHGRAKSANSNSQVNRPPLDERAVSQPAAVPADRDELARAEVARSSEVPTGPRSEEFGFER